MIQPTEAEGNHPNLFSGPKAVDPSRLIKPENRYFPS